MQVSRKKTSTQILQIQKNVCVDFMKAYQDQRIDQMLALSHPESTIAFLPLGDDGKGKIHELGHQLWTLLIDCFPDLDHTVHSMTAEDGAVHCKVSIRGSQAKDFFDVPNQGGKFDSEHIFVFRLNEEHEIEHLDVSWDHADFVGQLAS